MKKHISFLLSVIISILTSTQLCISANNEIAVPDFINNIRSEYINISSEETSLITDLHYLPEGYIYERYEIKFNINADYQNPFDTADITADCIITYPSGRSAVIPAFYIQEKEYTAAENTTLMTYNNNSYKSINDPYWCVRFSGDEIGRYSFSLRVVTSGGINQTENIGIFDLLNSNAAGYIDISENNPSYFEDTATDELFYGSGTNIAWVRTPFTSDPAHLKYEYFLEKAAAAGTTLTRVWLCHWAWLEWTPMENNESTYSYAGLGYYNQCISSSLDKIIEMCENYGLRVILTLDDNNEHMVSDNGNEASYSGWEYNPYNYTNGGPVSDLSTYYSNTAVRRHYKNRLRYIIARWGYSSSLMSLNLWNDEFQPTDSVVDYLSDLNTYTDSVTENYRPLLFGSNYKYAANSVLDYTTQDLGTSNSAKPSVTQECYFTKNRNYFKSSLRNTIWNEFFSGSASTMVWDHDAVDETDSWDVFTNLLSFVKNVPLNKHIYSNHYSLQSFAETWKSGGVTPLIEIKNEKLHITANTVTGQSNVRIFLDSARMPENTSSISFYYDATENNESISDFRILLKSGSNSYMPWYGKVYYFTPCGEETQTLTVSGNSQWSSWLHVPGCTSGYITIPLETFKLDADNAKYNEIDGAYKHDPFNEIGNSFTLTLQQNGAASVGSVIKVGDISWCTPSGIFTAQNFSKYTASFAASADTTVSPYKTIKATALGDVGGWKERAAENTFYIDENDNDTLLAGISSKLYGSNANVSPYKNDPTFIVNCSVGGKMIIQLNEIGAGRNYFEITKNGSQYIKQLLDGGRRYLEENEKYITVDLEPGLNRIKLSNSGQDWISIAGYYFQFNTVSNAGGALIKRLISSNQQLAYIYNTTYSEINQSILKNSPVDIENVVIPFYELCNCEYSATVYDTVSGATLNSFTFTPVNGCYEITVSSLAEGVAVKLSKK